jgi:peptide/nickel transport system permease protein
MVKYIGKRLLLAIPTLIGVSIIVFVIIRLIPGDPVASLMGPTSTAEEREAFRSRLGLDQPIPVQYAIWLGGILVGDAGMSIARQEPAMDLVLRAFSQTAVLSGAAALIAIVGGLVLASSRVMSRNRVVQSVSSFISTFAMSAPQYSIALIFIVVFSVGLGWFPSGGTGSAGGSSLGNTLWYLTLPAVAASLVPLGIIARMAASSLRDEISAGYVEQLHARGIPRWKVNGHILHNTVPSILTISGLQVGYLLGGVVFIEVIFSWPGLGQAVYQAITQRDLPVIQAGILVAALAFVAVNLVVDVLQGIVDPRLRR